MRGTPDRYAPGSKLCRYERPSRRQAHSVRRALSYLRAEAHECFRLPLRDCPRLAPDCQIRSSVPASVPFLRAFRSCEHPTDTRSANRLVRMSALYPARKPAIPCLGGAAHARISGPRRGSGDPRARQGARAISEPRRTAPLTLSAHTWSSLARTPDIWGYSYPHDETTNFNVDFPAPASRKVATKPTRFVHPHSWSQPTKKPTFPHEQAKKSQHNQHVFGL